MKKILFLLIFSVILLSPVLSLANKNGSVDKFIGALVNCGYNGEPCGFGDICKTIKGAIKIFQEIATGAAILFITIGGIMLMVSAGNPELKNLGKKVLFTAIIGTLLALGASEIISAILTALGSKYGINC